MSTELMIEVTSREGGLFDVAFRANGKKIGEFIRLEDGAYYFLAGEGAWPAYVLRDVATLLDAINQ